METRGLVSFFSFHSEIILLFSSLFVLFDGTLKYSQKAKCKRVL